MDFQDLLSADLADLHPQAPESLQEIAFHRLEEMIVRLEFAPRSVLTEKRLAAAIGIGRTPVREAIQRLALAGLLEVRPRRGIYVTDVDGESVRRMLEVSRGIDSAVARGAALRATPAQRRSLMRIAAEFESAASRHDPVGLLRADSEFNALCLAAMDNEHATKICRMIHPHTRRFWFCHHEASGDLVLGPRLHARAARAVSAGDADKAEDAFRRINDYLESFVRAIL